MMGNFFYYSGLIGWMVAIYFTIRVLYVAYVPHRSKVLFRDYYRIPSDVFMIIFKDSPQQCREMITRIEANIPDYRKKHLPYKIVTFFIRWKAKK